MSDHVEKIRREREEIMERGKREQGEYEGKSKHPRFSNAVAKVKEGASRVGHAAKEQISNPKSATRKTAHGLRRVGEGLNQEANRVANSKGFKHVTENTVDMVHGKTEGTLRVHTREAPNISMSLFGSGSEQHGQPAHSLIPDFGFKGSSRKGRGNSKSFKRHIETVTVNGKTYSRKIKNKSRKHKRRHQKTHQSTKSTWSIL